MNRTALARPLRRARSPLGGLTRALGIPAATLLCAASLATADPDIAGKLEGAADLRARPSIQRPSRMSAMMITAVS